MKDLKPIIILSATLVAVTLFAGWVWTNRNKGNDTISVNGYGQIDFESDLISWKGSTVQYDANLETAYKKLKANQESIRDFFAKAGIKESEITFSAVQIDKIEKELYNAAGDITGRTFDRYALQQEVKIVSAEVDKLEALSRNVTELIKLGMEFYSERPDYFYTKLVDLKLELIAQATKDARNRALKITENAGARLGRLRNSDMGVFQITEKNSADEPSWDGAYNTKARYKTATVTVRVIYQLN